MGSKAVAIARILHERLDANGQPLTLGEAIAVAVQLDSNEGEALLALERLVQTGVVQRVFLDQTQTPSVPLSWDQVLDCLGGAEGLAGERWRERARSISVQWMRAEELNEA